MTNRQKISERLLADLAVVWERHGASVLERLAVSDPGKLATLLASIARTMKASAGQTVTEQVR